MAKKKQAEANEAAADNAEANDVAAVEQPEAKVAKSTTVDIVVKRDVLPCGDRMLKRGDKLASVTLEPGVSLNFLACAVENSFCGQAPAAE